MEAALVGGTIAEEAGHHLVGTLVLTGEGYTSSSGQDATDDARGANDAPFPVGNMDLAALAAAYTVLAAQYLS